MRVLKVFLGILVGVILVCAASVVVAFVFKDRVPILAEIPAPEKYEKITPNQFNVVTSNIENSKNATITYQSTKSELEHYGQEIRYISGRIEPLTNQESMRGDIPTDTFPKASSSSVATELTPISDADTTEDNNL